MTWQRAPGIPLNELDKMFYCWERFGYAAMVRTRIELTGGSVSLHWLRQAYAAAVGRWPVLRSLLVERTNPGWDMHWSPMPAPDPRQAVAFKDFSALPMDTAEAQATELLFDPLEGFSCRTSPPFFMQLCRLSATRSVLHVYIHHAVADVGGIMRVLQEIVSAYNRLAAGDVPAVPGRAEPPADTREPLMPRSRARRLLYAAEAIGDGIARGVTSHGRPATKFFRGKSVFSGKTWAVFREIPGELLAQLQSAAKAYGASLSALLAAGQLAALDRWSRERGFRPGTISTQVHVRLPGEDGGGALLGNRFSTMFVLSNERHRSDPATLVRHVSRQYEVARRRRSARKLLALLWPLNTRIGAATVKLWGNFIFNNPLLGESTQVSNLGRWSLAPRLGDAAISSCHMAGPPVPSIGSLSAFLTVNDRLFYAFNYFQWAIKGSEAFRFVNLFEEAMTELAGPASEKRKIGLIAA